MKRFWRLIWLGVICLFLARGLPARAGDAVVHAVLFYSPSCPHCHQVISEDLPPLLEAYGEQFNIVAVNTAHPVGQELYQATVQRFEVPQERQGVPTLIVGNNVLVGSLEIPQQLPALIDGYLDQGGIGWPDIPGLAEILEDAEPTAEPSTPTASPTPTAAVPTKRTSPDPTGTAPPEPTGPASPTPTQEVVADSGPTDLPTEAATVRDITGSVPDGAFARFHRDVPGNSLSLLVLLGMVGATVGVTMGSRKRPGAPNSGARSERAQWATLALVLVGIGVSLYMAYVETTDTTAVCGPVGDCNTVQQSVYADLFGVVPIGVIGVLGYAALGLSWTMGRLCRGRWGRWARVMLPAMALAGTLFSIYLTFLEPFVIGATCLWCLTSAVVITLVLLLTADGGRTALAEPMARSDKGH